MSKLNSTQEVKPEDAIGDSSMNLTNGSLATSESKVIDREAIATQSQYRKLIVEDFANAINTHYSEMGDELIHKMACELLILRLRSNITIGSIRERLEEGWHPEDIFHASREAKETVREEDDQETSATEDLMAKQITVLCHGQGVPFLKWFANRDSSVQKRIELDIKHLAQGYEGKISSIKHAPCKLHEIRIFGNIALRIYFVMPTEDRVILLGGGDKTTQSIDVKSYGEMWLGSQKDPSTVDYQFSRVAPPSS